MADSLGQTFDHRSFRCGQMTLIAICHQQQSKPEIADWKDFISFIQVFWDVTTSEITASKAKDTWLPHLVIFTKKNISERKLEKKKTQGVRY